jgi:polysaccharide deacetylase family protein (PEP-CTERM system associated)
VRVPLEPPAEIVNVLTVDVEEYYHAVEVGHAAGPGGVARLPSRVVAETERLLDLCDEYGARGTFFTLGTVARRFPQLVRTITARGHELGSHGWDHTPVYELGPDLFRRDIRRSKRVLEQAAGQAVHGYRAPVYSIRPDMPWALTILAEEGFRYDSSVHPIAHDRYGRPDAPRFPHVALASRGALLWEVPVGTARVAGVNVPVGGGFFRLFPLPLLRGAIASVNRREGQPLVLYVHPWEFDPEQPRLTMPWRHRFRHYVGLRRAEDRLRGLLASFRFTSIATAFAPVCASAQGKPACAS